LIEGFIDEFVKIMMDEEEPLDIRTEAGFAVCNGLTGSTTPLVNYFFGIQTMKAILIQAISRAAPKICTLVLQSLKTFLHTGITTQDHKFWEEFKKLGAKQYVELLQYDDDTGKEATKLLSYLLT
jgi:hypothetical protein